MNILSFNPAGMGETDNEEIMKHLGDTARLAERLKEHPYQPHELLKMGREHVERGDYLEAKVIFDELHEICVTPKMKHLSDLYGLLIFDFAMATLPENLREGGKPSIERIIYSMSESQRMYAEKKLLKEDLFAIEKLVDRIPFGKMTIPGRAEFEKIYCKFKEYNLDVFLGKKESQICL